MSDSGVLLFLQMKMVYIVICISLWQSFSVIRCPCVVDKASPKIHYLLSLRNSLTCRVTDVTNVTSPEACGKDQTVGQERCYKYDVTLTIDGFRVDHLGSFCRCSNPTVSTIHPGWAFHE